MKVLVFSDLHNNKASFEKLIMKAKQVDLIVCAGDISLFSVNLGKIIAKFKETKKPLIIIPGNHESPESLEKIRGEYIIPLHKRIYRINDLLFVGYGTDGFSHEDRKFEEFIKKVKQYIKKEDKVILITHGPPYGTKLDKLPHVDHVGNKSYRKAITFLNPLFYFCGHLHENFNKKDKIGKTWIINPGPEGKIINIL